jgi:P4 family phage/plasmid primase-like protien
MSNNFSSPRLPDFTLFEAVAKAGFTLIALNGKRPIDAQWTKRLYKNAETLLDLKAKGRNAGLRIPPNVYVLDVDKLTKKGERGLLSLRILRDNLQFEFGTDLLKGRHCVVTGSGGRHLYGTIPEGLPTIATLRDYPGVQVRRVGNQVVLPGSIHPDTGQLYRFVKGSPDWSVPLKPWPPEFLELIRRKASDSEEVSGGGKYTTEQVKRRLAHLDPCAFADYAEYLRLMMAVKDACLAACEIFLEWSAGDPTYANCEEENRRKWDSLKSGGVTDKTLDWYVRQAAPAKAAALAAAEDFDEPIEECYEADDGALPEVWKPLSNNPYLSAQKFRANDRPTLLHFNGDWLAFDGSCYREIEPGTIKAEQYRFLGTGFRPAKKHVSDCEDALRAVAHVARHEYDPPCWLDGEGKFDPRETLALKDALLHLPSGGTIRTTPNFFTRNAIDYPYDPKAPEPTHWLKFLDSVFKDAESNIGLLQEIFGYLLLPDTRQQKIFLWDSPPRGGKGTTMRVLQKLIGPLNCASPTLRGIGTDPILASFIGKQVGIVSDMRVDKANLGAVAENLLRISGEDSLTFDRKYKSAWTGKLDIRFVILTNLPPNIPDVSGALTNRMEPLVSYQSFLGREDLTLESKLMPELPGILLWAIEGYRRLSERGRFVHSSEGAGLLNRMTDLASPLPAFIRECCELDPQAITTKESVYKAWSQWSDDKPGVPMKDENYFARDLIAAGGGKIRPCRPRKGGGRENCWRGIRLAIDFG